MHKLHVSYSNSAEQARCTRVQSPKHQICAKTLLLVSCSVTLIVFLKACANVIRATNIFPNSSKSFINLLSTKRSTEVFPRVSGKIKAPSTFINVSIVILVFCKKTKKSKTIIITLQQLFIPYIYYNIQQ